VIPHAAAALFLGCAAASFGWAAERVNVATQSRGLRELPVVVALRAGFFRSEGLEVEKIYVHSDVAAKALGTGEVAFNLGWNAPLRAAISGAPLKLIAVLVGRPLHQLLARPEIRSGKDLKGKTLGVDEFFSETDFLTGVALRFLGVEPGRDVKWVEVGSGMLRLDALKAGEIHATLTDLPAALAFEREPLRRLLSVGDVLDLPVFGVAVSAAKLEKDRDQVRKFVRAVLRGARFVKRNRADTVRVIQHHLKLTPGEASGAYDSAVRHFTEDGLVSDRAIALAVRRARDHPAPPKDFALDRIFDWSVAREIGAERRKLPFWLRRYDP